MNNTRWVRLALPLVLGLGLAALTLGLGLAVPVRADPSVHCVNASGTGCGGDCGSCHASVQAAVDAASPGHLVRIAAGTYTPGGTVARITKSVELWGGYPPDFTGFDPDMYCTVLDAGGNGSVISITNATNVELHHLTLTNGDGTGNLAGLGGGGGIYNYNTNLLVANSVVSGNVGSQAGEGWGGGLYAYSDGSHAISLVDSRIVNNTGSVDDSQSNYDGEGGGIKILGGEAFLARNRIVDNLAHATNEGWGGGIYLVSLTWGEVLTNVIQDNVGSRAGYSHGSGLYVEGGQRVLVAGNRIENNWSASGNGGGLESAYVDRLEVTGNRIVSNTGGSSGGGLYIRTLTPVTVTNNLVVRNDSHGYGEGIYLSGGYSPSSSVLYVLANNTIADNMDEGIRTVAYVTVTMVNNLLANNPVGIGTAQPASLTLVADTNLFYNTSDPLTGTNGILEDPLLWPSYHLREGSPAEDAGLSIPWVTGDLEGTSRPQGSDYDIGAFEGVRWFVDLPLVMRE